jgi:colanic acid biosynthesis glycosyl transferase WcaI
MCPELVKRGVQVTAFVAPPYYPEWQVQKPYSGWHYKKEYLNGVEVLRCPLYVPRDVTTIKRLIHLVSFSFSSGFALFSKLFKKPDAIMLVQPTLFCAPFTLLFAKLTGAKAIMHIQDYEVDALFGLGLMGDGKVAKIAKKIESWLLKRFDAVSTISYSMIDNAKAKGVDESKLIYFPNWANTEFVNPSVCGKAKRTEFGYTADDKVVLYSGNIGKKQGLEVVIEAAAHFKSNAHVKFLIIGSGSYSEELKSLVETQQLQNVQFLPLQPWEDVPKILSMADIHLVVQKKGAADAVLPSKLTNILSCGGHALVTAEHHTELGKIAEAHPGIYSLVTPECTQAFIAGLEHTLKQDTQATNSIARGYAEQNLNIQNVIDRFVSDLNALVKGKS